jgi:hypothetical protein
VETRVQAIAILRTNRFLMLKVGQGASMNLPTVFPRIHLLHLQKALHGKELALKEAVMEPVTIEIQAKTFIGIRPIMEPLIGIIGRLMVLNIGFGQMGVWILSHNMRWK